MQFELNHKIGTQQTEVTFTGQLYRFKPSVTKALVGAFEKLGGQVDHEINSCKYFFPMFVTSEIIEEIIRNTCFECGGLMKDEIQFVNLKLKNKKTDTIQINVRRCTICGHSHT